MNSRAFVHEVDDGQRSGDVGMRHPQASQPRRGGRPMTASKGGVSRIGSGERIIAGGPLRRLSASRSGKATGPSGDNSRGGMQSVRQPGLTGPKGDGPGGGITVGAPALHR
jgi:hypothetical protein